MGDDDTVFFTDNLVSVLAKYDHHLMYYVGANSESVEQDVMHSYEMAFGGGGFAISYPLAAELAKVLDGCVYRYYTFYGSDQKIAACMNEIGVSLTRERGFHQVRRCFCFIILALAMIVSDLRLIEKKKKLYYEYIESNQYIYGMDQNFITLT